MPSRPAPSTNKAWVVVPTVNKPASVVVPMPTRPSPLPESTYNNGVLVSVDVPIAISPQTSSVYLGEDVAMPILLVGSLRTYTRLAIVVVPVKVELAETMSPMVEVGLMALGPMNCQLDPPLLETADQVRVPEPLFIK